MKMLITGALGHIGSKFIHSINPGTFEEIILLDNLSTQRYCSLFNLPTGTRFKFVEDDVCTANLERYLDGIDVVVHLAAITNAPGSFEIQEQVEKVNFQGTERVARVCLAAKTRLIFLSTTSVYGVQDGLVDELCPFDQLRPQSPYASCKLRAELLLQDMTTKDGLKAIILRFGTIFGTSIGMRFHTAVNKFCWQAVVGHPLTVWRTAFNQYRPYLDLRDGVEAIKFIIDRDWFDGAVYNVVTTNATVGEVVAAISKYIPDIHVEFVDNPIMNQLSYNVSNDRFRKLGFSFQGNLEGAIGETISLLSGIRNHTISVKGAEKAKAL